MVFYLCYLSRRLLLLHIRWLALSCGSANCRWMHPRDPADKGASRVRAGRAHCCWRLSGRLLKERSWSFSRACMRSVAERVCSGCKGWKSICQRCGFVGEGRFSAGRRRHSCISQPADTVHRIDLALAGLRAGFSCLGCKMCVTVPG